MPPDTGSVHGPLDVIHLAAIRGAPGLSELTDYTALFVTKEVADEVKGFNDVLGGQVVPIRFAPPGALLEKDAPVLLVVADVRVGCGPCARSPPCSSRGCECRRHW